MENWQIGMKLQFKKVWLLVTVKICVENSQENLISDSQDSENEILNFNGHLKCQIHCISIQR